MNPSKKKNLSMGDDDMSDKVICNCGAVNPNLSMKCHSCSLVFPTEEAMSDKVSECKMNQQEQNDKVIMKKTATLSEENSKLKALLGEAIERLDIEIAILEGVGADGSAGSLLELREKLQEASK